MELEFRRLVSGNIHLKDVNLEILAALPDDDLDIFFDTTSVSGTIFKGKVLALRNRYMKILGIK